MRVVLWLFVVASCVLADSKNQVFSDFTTPLPVRPGEILILGVVGGWERWDAPQKSVRRAALDLRAMQLPGVWIETLENHKLYLAEELVLRAFDINQSGELDLKEKTAARLIVYGQSFGGRATLQFCRWLNQLGVKVLLAVVVDSYGRDSYLVPPNVAVAANLYQRERFIRGTSKITAEDPACTKILGNWRYTYNGRNIPMPGEPWIRRFFIGPHLKMEYDLEPWNLVKRLIVSAVKTEKPEGSGQKLIRSGEQETVF